MKRVDGGWHCQWGRGRSVGEDEGSKRKMRWRGGRAGSVEKRG